MAHHEPHIPLAVVGAGVFGLSTALCLADHGFSNVTVFDFQPYSLTLYDPAKGCDAASADVNKILRASYGDKAEHQRLAYAARERWKAWNMGKQKTTIIQALLAALPVDQRPRGLESTKDLYVESGYLRLPDSRRHHLSRQERASLANLENQFPEYRAKSYIIDDPEELKRAKADGWKNKIDTVKWNGTGVLDTTAGFIRADKACIWLAYLARKAGVRFVEGEQGGRVVNFVKDFSPDIAGEYGVKGVLTADGKTHDAALVIVAAGGWTPILVPSARGLIETTAGSIISLKLPPKADQPDLWERFSETNWPIISRDTDNKLSVAVYSFPHIDGVIKIGYRDTKFTNYAESPDGSRISTPITASSTPSETNIPISALNAAKEYIREHFPELLPSEISYTRLCWYTDSIDNNFLIDYVPGYRKSLFVASGGSGHGFKFAPVLGDHILDALCGRETDLTALWKWRSVPQGKRNGLEEGEKGPRVLYKQVLATEKDWKIDPAVV